jgi:hypothetical protein
MSQPKTITSLEFSAPIRTISEANQSEHWRVKHRRKKAQQKEMNAEWLQAAKGRKIALPCLVRFVRIGAKSLDADNLAGSFKHVQDEVARLLGVDDGGNQVRWEYDQVPIGERKYSVRVEVRSL